MHDAETAWPQRRAGRPVGGVRALSLGLRPDPLELVCPVAGIRALRAALEAGADTVCYAASSATENLALALVEAVGYAHERGRRLLLALDGHPGPAALDAYRRAIEAAGEAGADGLLLDDLGVMVCALETQPQLRRHLSAAAAATTPEAIRFHAEILGVRRVALPARMTLEAIATLRREIDVETEAVVAGSAEARATAARLAGLQAAGIDAIMIEAQSLDLGTEAVVRGFRRALDALADGRVPPASDDAWADALLGDRH